MKKYLLKRLLVIIPTFFGITVLVYFISTLMPGGPLELLMSNPDISAEEIERQRVALGLDQAVYIRYFLWLGELFQGNLGYSYRTGQPVLSLILTRLQPTLMLSISALVLALLIAIPLGILAAVKPYSIWDYISSGISFLFAAIPTFFTGLVFIYVFVVVLGILPLGGMYDSSGERTYGMLIRHMILPTVVLSFQQIGSTTRYMRGSMLEVLQEDYIRTGKAKGLKRMAVIYHHAVRNALIPVVTNIGLSITSLVGGAVITEQVFSWPGIGTLMIQSINSRDYPVIMGITVLIAIMVLLGNLLTDLIYGKLDPRIGYQ